MLKNLMRIGIVGTGFIGRAHARCCHDLEEVELVAVSDLDENSAKAVGNEFGGRYYRDYHEMFTQDDLDAVIICLPDHMHLEVSQAAASAGKHILLEKPIATKLEDADAIVQTAEESGVRLMVGHSLRYNLQFNSLFDRVQKGVIGQPVHGWARRNARVIDGRRFHGNTSVVMFLAVHDIDFLRWCVGSEVVRVYAEANRKVLIDEGVDDSVLSILKFANGFIASLEHCWILPENFGAVVDSKLEIVGDKGMISVDFFDQGLFSWNSEGANYFPPSEFLGQIRSSLYEQLKHFTACIHSGKEFLTTGDEARRTLQVALAIHESLDKQAPVNLD